MSAVVPADQIERIVGIQRHITRHYARAVSSEQTVYILHSQRCLEMRDDLRQCLFSLALDKGINESSWSDAEDQAVRVTINRSGRLIPVRPGIRLSE